MSKIWDALQKVEENREEIPSGPRAIADRPRLTAKQLAAIAALLDTDILEQVAERSGVSERTLRKWLEQPSFVAAYYAAARRRVAESTLRLQASTVEAVEVLRKALGDEDPAVRIQAAAAILRSASALSPDDGEEGG